MGVRWWSWIPSLMLQCIILSSFQISLNQSARKYIHLSIRTQSNRVRSKWKLSLFSLVWLSYGTISWLPLQKRWYVPAELSKTIQPNWNLVLVLFSGNHSLLQAEFHLVRDIGYYMVQMYIPSMLIVMLSWISFWLNVNAVPGRISLGVLTVLTMTQQSSTVNATLPRVSYTKAIDIWMSMCLVFVFAALIEFAVANVLARKDSNKGFSFKKMFLLPTLSEKRKKRKGSGVRQSFWKRVQNFLRLLFCDKIISNILAHLEFFSKMYK